MWLWSGAALRRSIPSSGVRQEVAFILNTEHGELLCVFLEIDKDMSEADQAFFSSPFEIDHQHLAVMDETTHSGAAGRVHAEFTYALKNPAEGKREVHLL